MEHQRHWRVGSSILLVALLNVQGSVGRDWFCSLKEMLWGHYRKNIGLSIQKLYTSEYAFWGRHMNMWNKVKQVVILAAR